MLAWMPIELIIIFASIRWSNRRRKLANRKMSNSLLENDGIIIYRYMAGIKAWWYIKDEKKIEIHTGEYSANIRWEPR